ncbi:MAG: redox-regulated ATPase YchF [Ignavibacteriaceae bacterium]|nr:redox-regulated ATPase YchF [Ignavibacteriaceae bacterium]NUM70950.1 redox-regulated ATPase YchF [Ignavibacteriaceae bacterium]
MQIGLIGLQNSGKTTLFRLLSGLEGDGDRTSVKVPDKRLDHLTELFNPKKQVNAVLEVVDIPGLRISDDGKMKITSDFLAKIKNNDLLLHIVREFESDMVPHPEDSIDPVRDIQFLETEFILADLEFVENRIEKIKKDLQKLKQDRLVKELPIMEKFKEVLENERPVREVPLTDEDLKILSGYQLLTMKPIIIGINFSENSKDKVQDIIGRIEGIYPQYKGSIIPFFGQFELELAVLSEEEAQLFKEDMGIHESALERILSTSYQYLGLKSFFTVGEDETRAWTIKTGYTAQQSAAVIHSDFFNKFIRAEVVHYDDYVKYGSFPKCKEAGVWRLEGKEYQVKDGDILNIRHS